MNLKNFELNNVVNTESKAEAIPNLTYGKSKQANVITAITHTYTLYNRCALNSSANHYVFGNSVLRIFTIHANKSHTIVRCTGK